VQAQEADRPAVSEGSRQLLEQGIEAFRAERYEAARASFERALDADADNAEAHYMLSRVYYETPLFDKGAAGREITRARQLDPDNVEYMVAQLQQLRLPSWNNVAEFIQQQQRRELAQQILSIDSTNAFAHEELGATYIRDFWQYRNAIALPTFDLNRDEIGVREDEELGFSAEGAEGSQTLFEDPEAASSVPAQADFDNAFAVDLTDRFDVATLQAQGVGVLDLSKRADAAYDAAIGHLRKALEYDPRRRPVYDHLMRIYILNGAYDDALSMLERMYVFFPEDPETWTYLGFANHRLGRSDAAAKSFEEAFEYMRPEARQGFDDLTLILSDEDQTRYRKDPAGFATRFWTSQNPRYLTPYNERKLEHYARLVHADLLYAAEDVDLRGWDTQRGRILVRYGPPESDVTITGQFGEVIAGFGLAAEAQGVESGRQFAQGPDMDAQSNLFNVWDYGDFKFVFEDPIRNGEYRLYSPPADFFADVSAGFVERMDYEMIARERFREEPERYEYRPPGRDVRIPYVVNAFKGEDGKTDLYVHYGIPLGDQADTSGDLVELTVRTGAFLINDDRDITTERRRTLYGLKTSQVVSFEEARLWTDTQAMEAEPGDATVSVEFETAGGGAEAAQRREVVVPDYTDEALNVSDLMLAYQVEEDYEPGENGVSGGRVRRGDFVIQPAPWSVFDNQQPIYLYFETYDLEQNGEGQNQYAVEVTLKPKDTSSGIARLAKRVFGGDDGGVSVEFEAGGTGTEDATYTIINAEEQEPGLYTLTLRVRDTLSGQTAERTSDLFLE
jgi:GWxTD domain-containing protein